MTLIFSQKFLQLLASKPSIRFYLPDLHLGEISPVKVKQMYVFSISREVNLYWQNQELYVIKVLLGKGKLLNCANMC